MLLRPHYLEGNCCDLGAIAPLSQKHQDKVFQQDCPAIGKTLEIFFTDLNLSWQFRDKDSPKLWSSHLSQWWTSLQKGSWSAWFQSPRILVLLEMAILLSMVAAWIIPLFK